MISVLNLVLIGPALEDLLLRPVLAHQALLAQDLVPYGKKERSHKD